MRFVPSSLVEWPFVETEVSSTSTAGISDFSVEPSRTARQVKTLDGRFLSAAQTTEASIAFGELLSVNARITAAGIIPRDTTSSIIVGAHTSYGGGAGAALQLVRSGRLLLTLRADFGWLRSEDIVPARLPEPPKVTGNVWSVHPALAAAFALSPHVGLQGSFTVDWTRYDIGTRDDITGVDGALAAVLSADPVPLTLLLGFNASHEFGRDVFTPTADALFGSGGTEWNGEVGLYLASRRELDLGLVFQGQIAPAEGERRLFGLFRFGYYF